MLRSTINFLLILLPVYLFAQGNESTTISGELKKWHKITLTFDGPQTGEQNHYNPFLHYRLDVTFTNGAKTYIVPGYFAADGNAANTSATGGNKWRVHFSPDAVGEWQYQVSFRKGSMAAVAENPLSGNSGGFMDGQRGNFTVAPTDKQAPDFRAKGRLQYVNKPYLRFAETGDYFLKAGADAPENFLSYADFDGDFKTDGIRDNLVKTWEPHLKDWRPDDPTWQDGKGKAMIGALNYLASKGMNVFSFLPLNIAGDDRNVFPYISYDNYERLDVSKLDQWEIIFEHAQQLGLYLHFKTQEAENQGLLDGGDTGPQRRLYYRELIARFGHHLALNWNMGEENGLWLRNHPTPWQTTTQRLAMAQYFYDTDPYRHHVVIHNGQYFYDLLGPESKYTGLSIQTHRRDFSMVHPEVVEWRHLSQSQQHPWVIAVDEPGDAQFALLPDTDDPEHNIARQNALWGVFMGGGAGIEWYFGYQAAHSDLNCEDWRSRDKMWEQSRYLLDFFQQNDIPFWDMEPGDDLTADKNDYVFYRKNDVYVIYQKMGPKKPIRLDDIKGNFQLRWFNPRTGIFAGTAKMVKADGKLAIGLSPQETDKDWVILLQKPFEPIFSGKDWNGWYRFLRGSEKRGDPKSIFNIQPDGSIHVSGEVFGYMATEKTYDDFHLKLEFKWGDKKWAPRLELPRDAGILYRMPAGTPDKVWPKSIECQIQQGDVGDFWLIDSTTIVVNGVQTEPANFKRAIKERDAEKAHGEWNTVEVIAIDGHCTHIVNGVIVNEGFDASERSGHIVLQSEGAELFYRNIVIKELSE